MSKVLSHTGSQIYSFLYPIPAFHHLKPVLILQSNSVIAEKVSLLDTQKQRMLFLAKMGSGINSYEINILLVIYILLGESRTHYLGGYCDKSCNWPQMS